MMVVSKPLGGLLSVPDFGLSAVLSKKGRKRDFKGHCFETDEDKAQAAWKCCHINIKGSYNSMS